MENSCDSGRFPVAEFNNTVRMNPRWSTFICFIETLKGRTTISKRTARRSFLKLVDENDYAKKERGEVITFLFDFLKRQKQASVNLKQV